MMDLNRYLNPFYVNPEQMDLAHYLNHEWRGSLCRMQGLVELMTLADNKDAINLMREELKHLDELSRKLSKKLNKDG